MSQSVSTPTSLFRTGYITSFRGDLIWFLGLPLFALAFALAAQQWLSAVVLLSVALWIEYPHFFATFVRTYGLRDDWQQYKQRLIVGPIVLFALALAGYAFAPLTMTLLILLWTHQHFVMQLHGFTRITTSKHVSCLPRETHVLVGPFFGSLFYDFHTSTFHYVCKRLSYFWRFDSGFGRFARKAWVLAVLRPGVAAIFQTGYIVSKRADGLWFLALPFLAVGIALACQQWLTAVALLSVGLWLTLPHHYATWIRTYTLNDEWQYYKPRLIIGPIVIAVMTFLGLKYARLFTLLLVVALWDHQHSVMQQHGFARIYDFKAKTGSPTTPKFDLALNWFLYVNLFLTAPFFTNFWVRELYRFHFPISRQAVYAIHSVSYCATGVFLAFYLIHLVGEIRQGYKVNPVKYLFVGSSFFLWYFTSWSTNDLLVYGIAHQNHARAAVHRDYPLVPLEQGGTRRWKSGWEFPGCHLASGLGGGVRGHVDLIRVAVLLYFPTAFGSAWLWRGQLYQRL